MIDLDAARAKAQTGKPDDDVIVSRRWLAQVVREIEAARAAQARTSS